MAGTFVSADSGADERGGHQDGGRSLGSDHHPRRRADQGEGHDGKDRTVETHRDRYARDLGVRHPGGQGQRGHRQPGQHIGAQPQTGVRAHGVEQRQGAVEQRTTLRAFEGALAGVHVAVRHERSTVRALEVVRNLDHGRIMSGSASVHPAFAALSASSRVVNRSTPATAARSDGRRREARCVGIRQAGRVPGARCEHGRVTAGVGCACHRPRAVAHEPSRPGAARRSGLRCRRGSGSGHDDSLDVGWGGVGACRSRVCRRQRPIWPNEYADSDTDAVTERTRFSGGSGALSDLGLDRRVPLYGAWASGGAGVALALLATLLGAWSLWPWACC